MSAPVWLVTGAGSGVGRVIAVALASSGAEVLLTARNRERLEDTARWCGPGAGVVPADLADPAQVEALAASVEVRLEGRPLAGIVHAAGVGLWTSPATASGWSLVPLVNAVSPWNLTRYLEPAVLRGPGGRVLFVAGDPMFLRGLRPDLGRWTGTQGGRGVALALEAASAKVSLVRRLHRLWGGRASAFAFHPGLVKSRLAEGLPFPLAALGCLAQPFLAARCAAGEFLALDPGAPALSGTLVAGRKSYPDLPFAPDPAAEEALAQALEGAPAGTGGS